MKTKGIPIWEQYLEYIVLGVAVLILVGFAAMQILGNPNTVEVQGTGAVGPGEIDGMLEAKAAAIDSKIRGPAPQFAEPIPVASTFDERRAASISPATTLPVLATRITPAGDMVTRLGDRPFVVVQIAPAQKVITRQYFDTLSQETVTEFPDLLKTLPAAPPHDVTWITAAATFNVAEVLKQFGETGPNGEAALPPKWYNNTVDIVDIKVEREELSNGKWIASNTLEPIPGQLTVRPLLRDRIDAATREEILSLTRDPVGRNGIIRPEFYTGKANAWEPPSEVAVESTIENLPPEAQAAIEIRGKLDRAKRELARVQGQFDALKCPEDAPAPPPTGRGKGSTPPPTPGGPGGGSGLGSGGGGSRGLRDLDNNEANRATCNRLRDRLRVLNAQVSSLEIELAKYTSESAPAHEVPTDESESEVIVWAHDMQVQPGKTYRYRFVVEIYNPLFLRGNDLIAEQKSLAEQFAIASPPSTWSEPIVAHPPLRVFITAARPAGSAATGLSGIGGSAMAEVYRFHDGRWWLASFSTTAGDRIGASKGGARAGERTQQIDYSTDWFLLDVMPDITADSTEISQGIGAGVVLQSLTNEGLNQQRWPRLDAKSTQRAYLRQEVRAAEAAGAVAVR